MAPISSSYTFDKKLFALPPIVFKESFIDLKADFPDLSHHIEDIAQKIQNLKNNNQDSTFLYECLTINGVKQAVRIKHGPSDSHLPLSRSIVITELGKSYMVFNRYQGGDPRVGRGEFKKCSYAANLETFGLAAYCSARRLFPDSMQNRQEYEILSAIRVAVPGSFFSKQSKGVWKDCWLERLEDGDLLELLDNHPEYLEDPKMRLHLALQIANQLAFLHGKGFFHLDIKPDNILYSLLDNGSLRLRVSDFGLSLKKGDPIAEIRGSPLFISPEAMQEHCMKASPLTFPSEQHEGWQLGMTLLAMFFRHLDPQFREANPLLSTYISKFRQGLTQQLDFIKLMWVTHYLTQDKWVKEPANQEGLEFVIARLLTIDRIERWTPTQARDYLKTFFVSPSS